MRLRAKRTGGWLEIRPEDGAFYLLTMNDRDECIADTWHQTVAEAKAQAAYEFGTRDTDWEEIR